MPSSWIFSVVLPELPPSNISPDGEAQLDGPDLIMIIINTELKRTFGNIGANVSHVDIYQ